MVSEPEVGVASFEQLQVGEKIDKKQSPPVSMSPGLTSMLLPDFFSP